MRRTQTTLSFVKVICDILTLQYKFIGVRMSIYTHSLSPDNAAPRTLATLRLPSSFQLNFTFQTSSVLSSSVPLLLQLNHLTQARVHS